MSQFTDYGENRLADMIRAQAWSLPSNLYLALASAVADGSITELSGTGYTRITVPRSLTSWASTQGNTAISNGTTHASSNSTLADWGTSGAAWGTANYVAVYDASTAGNAICYFPIATPIAVSAAGVPVSLAAGALTFTLGLAGGCSDYLANKLIDFIFRGQAFTWPATMYEALLTAAPTNAGGGTEVGGGGGYARAAVAGSLGSWSGTQAPGTTAASTGTGGLISNNAPIAFAGPVTAAWGAVGWQAEYDAATGGNLLFWSPLATAKTISAGASPPSFAAGARTITFA